MTSYTKEPLIIIDGYSFIFRSYYVHSNLTTPDNEPIGAIYGFISMLLKVINQFTTNKIVIVLDSGSKNFRHEIYPQYKANRPKAPEDLVFQLKLIDEISNNLGFAVLKQNGYEADDIIATLANKANQQKYNAIIISSDKDLMQLIGEHVKMYDAAKSKYLGEKEVEEKFGVTPNKMHLIQSLMGDSSDNIPGVKGIGPKTAANIINQYGDIDSLDQIYSDLDRVTNDRQRKLLINHKDEAYISWELTKLIRDIDLDVHLKDFIHNRPDKNIISDMILRYGFVSLRKRMESAFKIDIKDHSDEVAKKRANYKINQNKEEANQESDDSRNTIIDNIKNENENQNKNNILIYIDQNSEDNQNTPNEILQKLSQEISDSGVIAIDYIKSKNHKDACDFIISIQNFNNIYIFRELDFTDKNSLLINYILDKIINNIAVKKIVFDVKKMRHDLNLDNISKIDDLLLMNYIIHSESKIKSIDDLCIKYNINIEKYLTKENGIYEKTKLMIHLYLLLEQKLLQFGLMHLYTDIDLPISTILYNMEKEGCNIDQESLNELTNKFTKQISELKEKIYHIADEEFNIDSPKQLGKILFEKLQLPYSKTSKKSGDYTTDVSVLEKLSNDNFEIADLLLEYRHIAKLKNTYAESLPKLVNVATGKIHTTFLQTSTNTGRLSSINPNIQNIPTRTAIGKEIRKAFIPSENNKLISADYSQIELRILAKVSKCQKLQQAFIDGRDIHMETAKDIFNLNMDEISDSDKKSYRRKAKAINFGIIYGISAFGLAKQINVSRSEAKQYIDSYFIKYPEIKEYMDKAVSVTKERGYIKNLIGRRCYISAIQSSSHLLVSFGKRAAINAPMQSLASDVAKLAMINIDKLIRQHKLKSRLIMQIHDELIFDAQENELEKLTGLISEAMTKLINIDILLKIDINIGNNWKEV